MQRFPASVVTEAVQLAVTWPRITLKQQLIFASGQQKPAVFQCHSNKLAEHYTQKGQGMQTQDCTLRPMHAYKYNACHTPNLSADKPEWTQSTPSGR